MLIFFFDSYKWHKVMSITWTSSYFYTLSSSLFFLINLKFIYMALSTFGETSNCWIIYIHTGDYKHVHTVTITLSLSLCLFFEAAWMPMLLSLHTNFSDLSHVVVKGSASSRRCWNYYYTLKWDGRRGRRINYIFLTMIDRMYIRVSERTLRCAQNGLSESLMTS